MTGNYMGLISTVEHQAEMARLRRELRETAANEYYKGFAGGFCVATVVYVLTYLVIQYAL